VIRFQQFNFKMNVELNKYLYIVEIFTHLNNIKNDILQSSVIDLYHYCMIFKMYFSTYNIIIIIIFTILYKLKKKEIIFNFGKLKQLLLCFSKQRKGHLLLEKIIFYTNKCRSNKY